MTPTQRAGLVQRDIVETAARAAEAARAKRDAVKQALANAEIAFVQAERASANVAGDPTTLAAEERKAQNDLTFARRSLAIAEKGATDAAGAQAAAWGEAHRPMHAKGVEIRLAAARRAQRARIELVMAEAEFANGTKLVMDARAERCPVTVDMAAHKINTQVTSEDAEAALWSA